MLMQWYAANTTFFFVVNVLFQEEMVKKTCRNEKKKKDIWIEIRSKETKSTLITPRPDI